MLLPFGEGLGGAVGEPGVLRQRVALGMLSV